MATVSRPVTSIVPPHRRVQQITGSSTITKSQLALAPHNRHSTNKSAHLTEKGAVDLPNMPTDRTCNPAQTVEHGPQRQRQKGRAEVTFPQRRKNDKWIKNSDLKKATKPPTGWDDNAPEGGSVKGANTQGYSLMDYDGSWAPPPEDWDTRPGFGDEKAGELIAGWLEKTDTDPRSVLKAFTHDAQSKNFYAEARASNGSTKRYHFVSTNDTDDIIGEIVPRSWIPRNIEALNDLQSFWQYHINTTPTPDNELDLVGAKPWWEMYPSPNAAFHHPPQEPVHKGIDITDENFKQRRDRQQDAGSNAAVARWLTRRANQRRAKQRSPRRSLGSDPKPVDSFLEEDSVPEHRRPLVPKVNLSIRSAQVSDMAQITELYNWHVSNGVCVPECHPVATTHMLDRLRCIKVVSLPFIVAYLPDSTVEKIKGKALGGSGKIIGIAYADDYNDMRGMYRFTAEVEMYVHHEYRQKGVARCLMDKLLHIVAEGYMPRGGYNVTDEDLGLGAQRTLSKLIMNVSYNEQDGTKKRLGPCLESFDFEQKGDVDDIGHKLGKRQEIRLSS